MEREDTVSVTQMTLGETIYSSYSVPASPVVPQPRETQTTQVEVTCQHPEEMTKVLIEHLLEQQKSLEGLTQAVLGLKLETVIHVPPQPPAPIVVRAPEINIPAAVPVKESVTSTQMWLLITGVYLLIAIFSWTYGLFDALFY